MKRLAILASLMLVASCNRSPAADGLIRAGNWTADVTVDSIDVPNMPPELVENFKKKYEIHRSKCLTPEDVRTPDRLLFGRPDGCEYSEQRMAGGKISGTMNCRSASEMQTIQLEGSYEPERYSLHINGMVEDREAGQTVSYVATLQARRTGACSLL